MGTMRAWRVVAALLLAATVPGSAAGCSSCDAGCGWDEESTGAGAEEEPVELVGTIVDIRHDEGVVRVANSAGEQRDIVVSGRVEVLREGATYIFPTFGDSAHLPAPCDCRDGHYVTDIDGNVVDTAYLSSLRSIDLPQLTLIVVGVGVVLIAGWALLRRRRGLPL